MIPIKVIHNLVTTIDHNNNAPPIITNILLTVIAPTLKANGGGAWDPRVVGTPCYHGNFLKEYPTKA